MNNITIKVLGYANAQALFDVLAGSFTTAHTIIWTEPKSHAWHKINYFTYNSVKQEEKFYKQCFPNARMYFQFGECLKCLTL